MTVTELLETVRRVELRTNRLVNDTMVGACLSHFKGRGMDIVSFPLTPTLSPRGEGWGEGKARTYIAEPRRTRFGQLQRGI